MFDPVGGAPFLPGSIADSRSESPEEGDGVKIQSRIGPPEAGVGEMLKAVT